MSEIKEGEPCPTCGDEYDQHVLIATAPDEDPMKGGISLCPVKGCQCFGTWSPPGHPVDPKDIVVPEQAKVEAMRKFVQAGLLR